jgi:hypothetical protein
MASNPDAWHDSAPRSSGVQYDIEELLVQLPDAAAVSAWVELGAEVTYTVDHPRGSALPSHGERRGGQPAGFLDLAGEQVAGGHVAHHQAVLFAGRRSDGDCLMQRWKGAGRRLELAPLVRELDGLVQLLG